MISKKILEKENRCRSKDEEGCRSNENDRIVRIQVA